MLLRRMNRYKPIHFKEDEFARCVPPCKLSDMNDKLLILLDFTRDYANIPIKLNSAYRSRSYERSKGRSGSSSHCSGLAVDIACNSNADRLKLLSGALSAGFRRIGIDTNFLHLDCDPDKPECIWLYNEDLPL